MTKYRKQLIYAIGILMVISLILNISLFRAFKVNPNKLNVNYMTLRHSKIPKEMDGVSIVYFTDLQFGEFSSDKKLETLTKTIQNLHPDILIFGGDMFDKKFKTNDKLNWKIADSLSSIEAPLGKFAVWGEKDMESNAHKKAMKWICSQAQIEILSDSSTKITNGSTNGIRLLGLSLEANSEYIISNTNVDTYSILISHYPDAFADPSLSSAAIHFALAGHSHGTQVTFPVYGGFREVKGAKKLNRAKTENLSFTYHISSGVGCTHVNARFQSTPEVVYIVLKHK